MTILKTDLSLFENIVGWDFKENFFPVSSEFGEINIHYVDENKDAEEVVDGIMVALSFCFCALVISAILGCDAYLGRFISAAGISVV